MSTPVEKVMKLSRASLRRDTMLCNPREYIQLVRRKNGISPPAEPSDLQYDVPWWTARLIEGTRQFAKVYGDTREEVEALARVMAGARKLLKFVSRYEWSGRSLDSPACPVCHGYKGVGHTPTCELGTLISMIEGKHLFPETSILVRYDPDSEVI